MKDLCFFLGGGRSFRASGVDGVGVGACRGMAASPLKWGRGLLRRHLRKGSAGQGWWWLGLRLGSRWRIQGAEGCSDPGHEWFRHLEEGFNWGPQFWSPGLGYWTFPPHHTCSPLLCGVAALQKARQAAVLCCGGVGIAVVAAAALPPPFKMAATAWVRGGSPRWCLALCPVTELPPCGRCCPREPRSRALWWG